VDAAFIKEVLQVEEFYEFFNDCKLHSVTAYKYNVVEYFPVLFKQLRADYALDDAVILQ
jgi:hypothetical protein